MIYSSGSVAAQKLLFRYTDIPDIKDGDLTVWLSGYFDTVIAGMKQDKASYEMIAKETGIKPGEWLFLSDNVKGEFRKVYCFSCLGSSYKVQNFLSGGVYVSIIPDLRQFLDLMTKSQSRMSNRHTQTAFFPPNLT